MTIFLIKNRNQSQSLKPQFQFLKRPKVNRFIKRESTISIQSQMSQKAEKTGSSSPLK